MLFYTIWIGDVRILNMPESAEICPNVVTFYVTLDKCNLECDFGNIPEIA